MYHRTRVSVALYIIYAVNRSALIKQNRIGRVFIFGCVFFASVNPSAESNYLVLGIYYRYYYPVCKRVGRSFQIGNQPAIQQILKRIFLESEIFYKTVIIKRQSKSVSFGCFIVYPAICQILASRLTLFLVYKIISIIPRGVAHKLLKHVSAFLFLLKLRVELHFGQLHTRLLGKIFYGVEKAHRLHFHYKLYNVAACTASEAMIKSVILRYAKRTCLFVMKRTTAKISATFFLQRNILRYNLYYIAFIFQFVQKFGCEALTHRPIQKIDTYIYLSLFAFS